ncbi:MAG: lysophospholipase [Tepidimonas sp.]|nr:lysophospholipase [Tepidimonas sp.]
MNLLKMRWMALVILTMTAAAHAGEVLRIPTRDGVRTTVFWEAVQSPRGTVLLFPGGGGGFGRVEDGKPQSGNFLVRSAGFFNEAGFNVAIFGRPSDLEELDYADRIGDAHLTDIARVLDAIKSRSAQPVWLVGTSRGTVSATAAGIRLQSEVAGIVLTSSVVSYKKVGAVPRQDLGAIKVPVLVVHHAKDACVHCRPHEVPLIIRGLTQAPVKRLVMVDGGADPVGDPCEARHWHGFIGMEREVVERIANWIAQPQ